MDDILSEKDRSYEAITILINYLHKSFMLWVVVFCTCGHVFKTHPFHLATFQLYFRSFCWSHVTINLRINQLTMVPEPN